VSVTLGEGKTATVIVPDRQLSLAIGKEGQNARLAAKLTGWRIDIVNQTAAAERALKMAEEITVRAEHERERRALEEQQRAEASALLAEAEASLSDEERIQVPPLAEGAVEAAERPAATATSETVAIVETSEFADVSFVNVPIEVTPEAVVDEDEETPVAMKGKKKAKKGKREIAIEQRQAAVKKKKAPVKRTTESSAADDLDWQHLRNVNADEILAEDEAAPAEALVEESEPEE